ncbi:MFS transporter [Microbispora sp. NPDC046933]|uniref:MFS transporter n=1 Tax=Microbispora sp. NPDC046933 TaxID=3155618 RepID=UPI0033F69115
MSKRGGGTAAFLIAGTAAFMAALDTLVITTALPTIRAELSASLESLEWTVNAYTLVYAVCLLAAAVIGDRFGRRRVFLTGLVLFTAASAAAALSVILYGNWQGIFWINVPIGLVLTPLAVRLLAESHGPYAKLDVRGLLLVVAGLFGIVFGLIRAASVGWAHPEVGGPVAAGVLLLVWFARWERRAAHPVLPPHLFRKRGFALSNLLALLLQGGMMGAVFLFVQFLQNVLGYPPLDAGLRTLPCTLMPVLVAPLAGAFGERLGVRRLLVAAAVMQAAALAWFAIVAGSAVPYLELLPGLVAAGVGMGLFFALGIRQTMDFVSAAEHGVASGVNNAMRQIGIVMGVAVLSGVFATAGGYGSAQAFVSGLRAALWTGAVIVSAAAVVALLIPAATSRGAEPGETGTPRSATALVTE